MPISTTTPCGSSSLWKLLSITRLENGGLDLRIQPELLEVAGEALQHLNRRSAEYPIRVDIEDDLLMAKMDSRLITQVIINIVNNAVKYTPPGTDITLSAPRGRHGAGGDRGYRPRHSAGGQGRLFQMFCTAGNDRGDGWRGLGLGLALPASPLWRRTAGEDRHAGQRAPRLRILLPCKQREIKLEQSKNTGGGGTTRPCAI